MRKFTIYSAQRAGTMGGYSQSCTSMDAEMAVTRRDNVITYMDVPMPEHLSHLGNEACRTRMFAAYRTADSMRGDRGTPTLMTEEDARMNLQRAYSLFMDPEWVTPPR